MGELKLSQHRRPGLLHMHRTLESRLGSRLEVSRDGASYLGSRLVVSRPEADRTGSGTACQVGNMAQRNTGFLPQSLEVLGMLR